MFREGRHVEKNKRRCEKTHRFFHWFFIDFSRKIDGKSCKKRENKLCAQKSTKNHVWIGIFQKKTIFSEFLGSPRVPRGVSGRPGKFTKSFIFLIYGQLRLKTRVDGLREASGRPRRSPQAPSGYDFASIFGSILHVKSKQKNTKSV